MRQWIFDKCRDLPRNELRWMVEHLVTRKRLGMNDVKIEWSSALDSFSLREKRILNGWIKDRIIRHKPLQYILKSQPFCGLDIRTRAPILIPRWETEEWTMRVIDMVKAHVEKESVKELKILDICSGSGCISLALAFHLANICKLKVVGIDKSKYACRLAALNQRSIGISKDVLKFVQADIFTTHIQGTFDLIVSNPPYISHESLSELEKDVLDWEDHAALFAEDDGLAFYKRILSLVPTIQSQESIACVVLEIGEGQAHDVLSISNGSDFVSREIWKDLAGRDRALFLRSNKN